MLENIELSKVPQKSGVYLFKDVDGVVIYVGSSKDLHNRMKDHRHSIKKGLNSNRNKDLYQFLQNNQFTVEFTLEENFLQLEQKLIEQYNPKYNNHRAYTGCGSKKGRESEYDKERYQKFKEEYKQYYKKYHKQHNSRPCNYNGEILTLNALAMRFKRAGIPHPNIEAKKYLIS